jgi:pyridoxamine 5'-phosphate oxidase
MSNDRSLNRNDLNDDPIVQFDLWYKEYLKSNPPEPAAMALATSTPSGDPRVRFVLLKEYNQQGFVFFTNFESEKGRALALNPKASLAFYWNVHNRQVRISGTVQKISDAESDHYFSTRPFESQLSTWASHQSQRIESRDVLEEGMNQLRAQYQGKTVPRPAYWGGYRVVPSVIEFWQGRTGRLHDRFVYSKQASSWKIERLSP